MSSLNDVEILRAACCIAGSDGTINDREQPMLQHLAHQAGVGAKSLEAMIDMAVNNPAFYEEQLEYTQKDPERTIRTLFVVAAADGQFTSQERTMLHHFAMKVGMSEEAYDRLLEEEREKLARA